MEADDREVEAIAFRLKGLYHTKFQDLAADCLVLHEKHIAFKGFGKYEQEQEHPPVATAARDEVDFYIAETSTSESDDDKHTHPSASSRSSFALAVLFYRLVQLTREAPVLPHEPTLTRVVQSVEEQLQRASAASTSAANPNSNCNTTNMLCLAKLCKWLVFYCSMKRSGATGAALDSSLRLCRKLFALLMAANSNSNSNSNSAHASDAPPSSTTSASTSTE